jgi:hypothetical protein
MEAYGSQVKGSRKLGRSGTKVKARRVCSSSAQILNFPEVLIYSLSRSHLVGQTIMMQSTTAHSHSHSPLLKFPDELLRAVLLDVDLAETKGLKLSFCRLRPIEREVLLRSAPPVVINELWRFVDELQKWEFNNRVPHPCLRSCELGPVL